MNVDILLLHLDFSTIHCLYALRHLCWDTSENMKIKDGGFTLDNHFIFSHSSSRGL